MDTAGLAERHEFRGTDSLPNPRIKIFTWFSLHQLWRNIVGSFLVISKEKMKFEILRHATLLTYPRENKPDIVRIAVAGFYHNSGNDDEIACYCCGLTIRRLKKTDDPICLHHEISSMCPFFERNRDVNKRFFRPTDREILLLGDFEQGDLHAQEEMENTLSVQLETQRHEIHDQNEEPLQRFVEQTTEPLAEPNIITAHNERNDGNDVTNAYVEELHVHLYESYSSVNSENIIDGDIISTSEIDQDASVVATEHSDSRNVSLHNEHQFRHQSESVTSERQNAGREEVGDSEMPDNQNDADTSILVPIIQRPDTIQTNQHNNNSCEIQYRNVFRRFTEMTLKNILPQSETLNSITEETPGHLNGAPYRSRLATFHNWPRENLIAPEDLADAGFVYTGKDDHVSCTVCDLVLSHWENDDDPWIEHASHRPGCTYVLQVFGRSFPMTVVEKNQEDLKCYKEIFERRRKKLYNMS